MRSDARLLSAALALGSIVFAVTSASAQDQGQDLHGRLLLQEAVFASRPDSLQAALGARAADDAIGSLRVVWEPTWGRWSLQMHYVLATEIGPEARLARLEDGLLPEPPSTLLDLTDVFEDHGQLQASQSIDRLAVTYATPALVVRLGRQALTWGSGIVFRPMDLFDPFSPTATDTEYKPGVDMLYVQRLFGDGSDLQVIVAPRPARYGGPVSAEASSAALHYHATFLGHLTTLLVARDHGDWVSALSVNGALGGSTWNLEVVPTILRTGGVRTSAVANISDAVTLAGKNATVFAEYFRNGFGVAGEPYTLAELPPPLLARLERGQLFNTRRDYVAAGMTLEATPLLSVSPTLIVDLNDGSLVPLLAATWSLGDNLSLIGGAQAPLGRRRTEFGGLPLTATSEILLAPSSQIYLQLRRYF